MLFFKLWRTLICLNKLFKHAWSLKWFEILLYGIHIDEVHTIMRVTTSVLLNMCFVNYVLGPQGNGITLIICLKLH